MTPPPADIPVWLAPTAIIVLILLLAVMAATLWWFARREPEAATVGTETPGIALGDDEPGFRGEIRSRLSSALRDLARVSGRYDDPYSVPWILVAGIAGAEGWSLVDDVPGLSQANTRTQSVPRVGTVRFCRDGVAFHAGDGLGATVAGRRRWRRLLEATRSSRPQRPIDGLVVAIPAGILIGAEALPADALAEAGAGLHQQLAAVQRITGLRVPVNIVVSGCETVPGFAGMVQTLPRAARDEALGWTNPYSMDSRFQPAWVDEACEGVSATLWSLVIQLLLVDDAPPDRDGLAMLPAEIRAMAPRLRVLLSAAFQETAYQDGSLFRGLYFSGGGAFTQSLFTDKIFREFRLVRAVRGFITARNRRIRIVQTILVALLVVEVVWLGWVRRVVPRRAEPLTALMQEMQTDSAVASAQAGDSAALRMASNRLLQNLVRLDVTSIEFPAIPTTLLTGADRRIKNAIAAGYEAIVLAELRRRLADMLPTILASRPPDGWNPAADSADELRTLVDRLEEYQSQVLLFNRLPQSKSTAALASVVHYALGIQLGEDFFNNSDLYASALMSADVHEIDPPRREIDDALRRIFADAYSHRYNARGLADSLATVARLTHGGTPEERASPAESARLLTALRDQLHTVTSSLDAPELGWLNGKGTDLGVALDDVLRQVDNLVVAGPGLSGELRRMGENRLRSEREMLARMVAAGNVPLLQYDNSRFVLNPEMAALGRTLDSFLGRPFMTVPPTRYPSDPVDGSRPMLWETQRLTDAAQLAKDYVAFTETDVRAFPAALVEPARLAASDRVNRSLAQAVADAARPMGRTGMSSSDPFDMRAEIRSLTRALPALATLREALERAGFGSLSARLADTAHRQAGRLLAEVDRQPMAQAAYEPSDPSFSWWDGTLPFAARAYGASSAAELQVVLAADRDAITHLARDDAQPLVEILTEGGAAGSDSAAVRKWAGILAALAAYDQKQPDSSLLRLERFITTDMDKAEVERCSPLPGGVGLADDFFAARQETLRANIRARCLAVAHERVADSYGRLRSLFNDTLAGRFPFADADGALPDRPRANPDDVRAFFFELDQERASAHRDLAIGASLPVRNFLSTLAADESALASMLIDPALATPLAFRVEADFRTNPANDAGGNQVLEWVLDFGGDQRISSLGGKTTAVWTAGRPVRLSLRWARNAPNLPAAQGAANGRSPAVTDTVATWEYDDPWALLSLLADHRPAAADLAALPEHAPETLSLSVPLRANPDAATGVSSDLAEARVYLRLKLAALVRRPGQPEKAVPLAVPAFPLAAP